MFDDNEIKLLMGVQYGMPLTVDPFVDLADNLGLPVEFVFGKLKEFLEKGVIKRIGGSLNYKAFRVISKAALVGASVENGRIGEVAKIINSQKPKHNFLREHEKYNVWFTIKGKTEREVMDKTAMLMRQCNVEDYVTLPSKKVHKMDVKYDLIRGTSWSEKRVEPEEIPFVDDLCLDRELLKMVEKLEVVVRPFKGFEEFNYSEEEIVELIRELKKKGVIRDFSGVLSERRIGINENGMTIIKPSDTSKIQNLISRLINEIPQITHLVERKVPPGWPYPVYFMVHAERKGPIEEIRDYVSGFPEVEEARILYSKMDLKTLGV